MSWFGRHTQNIAVAAVTAALVAGGPAVAETVADYARNAGHLDGLDSTDFARAERVRHVATCHPMQFETVEQGVDDRAFLVDSGYASAGGVSDTWELRCPMALPDRARVTAFEVGVHDATADGSVVFCNLRRSDRSRQNVQEMAVVPGTEIGDAPGHAERSSVAIERAVVDNGTFVYEVKCVGVNGNDGNKARWTGVVWARIAYVLREVKATTPD